MDLGSILSSLDWSPLFISLKTGFAATLISFFLGIGAASLVLRISPRLRAVIDSILTLPLVLPPTVAGFFLLLLFSVRRPFGSFLLETFNIRIIQSWTGCVIAATVIAFPLMYRNARGAFEQVDINIIHAGRTLGLSEWTIFWKITLPAAAPGILSGTVLTFARAMGEYGATSMLAGNILGKTSTISQTIAIVMQDGNYAKAGVWTGIVIIIAFIILWIMNKAGSRKTYQKGWW